MTKTSQQLPKLSSSWEVFLVERPYLKMELRELSIISADLTTELDKRITQQERLEQQEKKDIA